jgi:hypothetical protein
MEAACTSETLALLPISTQCRRPKSRLKDQLSVSLFTYFTYEEIVVSHFGNKTKHHNSHVNKHVCIEAHPVSLLPVKLSSPQSEAVPVTGRAGPKGCETSRLPHFQDIRLTDGGKFVSPTRWPAFNPKKIPGTHFC